MIDRGYIGYETPPLSINVEQGQLRFFAKATGETNPIYTDENAAHAAGHHALPAPPTFAFVLNSLAREQQGAAGDIVEMLGINIAYVLHGEQGFEYFKTIYAGDRVAITTRINDIYRRKNGALEFVLLTVDIVNRSGELCVRQRKNLIVRNPGAME